MKYFTPDLVDRFGSLNDEMAAGAEAEWEQAVVAYQDYLASISQMLPKRFREMLGTVCLHDAVVTSWCESEDGVSRRFLVQLTPPSPNATPVLFAYVVKRSYPGRGAVDGDPVGARAESTGCYWMYDEVNAEEGNDFPVFSHAILLSDGRELHIPFSEFEMKDIASAPAAVTSHVGGAR
jgi:hypothetical protein